MIRNYVHELEKEYMPYAIINDNGEIIGFTEDITKKAKKAAIEHIEMSLKYDDVSNYNYWQNLLKTLNLL